MRVFRRAERTACLHFSSRPLFFPAHLRLLSRLLSDSLSHHSCYGGAAAQQRATARPSQRPVFHRLTTPARALWPQPAGDRRRDPCSHLEHARREKVPLGFASRSTPARRLRTPSPSRVHKHTRAATRTALFDLVRPLFAPSTPIAGDASLPARCRQPVNRRLWGPLRCVRHTNTPESTNRVNIRQQPGICDIRRATLLTRPFIPRSAVQHASLGFPSRRLSR